MGALKSAAIGYARAAGTGAADRPQGNLGCSLVDWSSTDAGFVIDAINTVANIMRSTAFYTANVTTPPQVLHIQSQNFGIVNALHVLAVIAARRWP